MTWKDFRGDLDKFDFAWQATLIFMETLLLKQYPIFYRQTFLSTILVGRNSPFVRNGANLFTTSTYWFQQGFARDQTYSRKLPEGD